MNYQVVDGHWYSQEQGGHVLSGCRWPMVVRSRVPMYYQVVDVQWQLGEGRPCVISRVGHRVLFRSERSVLFCSFKEHNILFRSFFEFLATYETLKNDAFFSILFLRAEKNPKNAKNATFFCKKSKRMPE